MLQKQRATEIMEQKRKDSVLTAEKGGGVISEDNSATSVAPSLNKRKES